MVIGWTSEFYEIMVWIMSVIGVAMVAITITWIHLAAQMDEYIHPQHRDRDELLNRIL